jgi:hypothetical protein
LVQHLITDSLEAFLLVDDSVQDKRYSQCIELVQRQYSGAEHDLVREIGIINLVHSSGQDGDFCEMLRRCMTDKLIQAKTVLFDSWYTAADNQKLIQRLNLIVFTILKENRLVT